MNGVIFRPPHMSDEEWTSYYRLHHPDGEEYPGQFDSDRKFLREKYNYPKEYPYKYTGVEREE